MANRDWNGDGKINSVDKSLGHHYTQKYSSSGAGGGLFSLIVVIGCSVNGLTFGEQVCEWFGGNAGTIADSAEQVAEAVAETPIA